MSSPVPQPRTRVTRIAQEAVDKARLSVVPRVRTRAPRVPFVTLVSLVLKFLAIALPWLALVLLIVLGWRSRFAAPLRRAWNKPVDQPNAE